MTSEFARSTAATGSPMLAGTAAGLSCFSTNHENASRPPRSHIRCGLPRESLNVTTAATVAVTAG
jgi:hypothetical protein